MKTASAAVMAFIIGYFQGTILGATSGVGLISALVVAVFLFMLSYLTEAK